MSLCKEQITDLELLLKFPTSSAMQGLKIHNDAPDTLQASAKRLFERGIIDRIDGGYLTELGHELQTHAFHLSNALK